MAIIIHAAPYSSGYARNFSGNCVGAAGLECRNAQCTVSWGVAGRSPSADASFVSRCPVPTYFVDARSRDFETGESLTWIDATCPSLNSRRTL